MKRTATLLASVAALALALTGCGSSSDDAAAGGSTLEQVQDSGVLTVGTEGTYRPFSFHDDSGKLTGYDVEVIEAVADKMGVKAEFEETQWDSMFAGLEAKRFDVVANQVGVNAERQEKYLLSDPYTVSSGVVVTRSDDDSIKSFDDLKGKTTAQSLTSNFRKMAEEAGAKIEGVEGWAQSVALLKQGRVDATVNDKLSFLDSQKTDNDTSIKIAAETEEKTTSAVALRKDSEDLRDAIDDALDELEADGELAAISKKYFGEDISK